MCRSMCVRVWVVGAYLVYDMIGNRLQATIENSQLNNCSNMANMHTKTALTRELLCLETSRKKKDIRPNMMEKKRMLCIEASECTTSQLEIKNKKKLWNVDHIFVRHFVISRGNATLFSRLLQTWCTVSIAVNHFDMILFELFAVENSQQSIAQISRQ